MDTLLLSDAQKRIIKKVSSMSLYKDTTDEALAEIGTSNNKFILVPGGNQVKGSGTFYFAVNYYVPNLQVYSKQKCFVFDNGVSLTEQLARSVTIGGFVKTFIPNFTNDNDEYRYDLVNNVQLHKPVENVLVEEQRQPIHVKRGEFWRDKKSEPKFVGAKNEITRLDGYFGIVNKDNYETILRYVDSYQYFIRVASGGAYAITYRDQYGIIKHIQVFYDKEIGYRTKENQIFFATLHDFLKAALTYKLEPIIVNPLNVSFFKEHVLPKFEPIAYEPKRIRRSGVLDEFKLLSGFQDKVVENEFIPDPRDAYSITPENIHKRFYITGEEGEEGRKKRRTNRRTKVKSCKKQRRNSRLCRK
jgi:hypothetical protein